MDVRSLKNEKNGCPISECCEKLGFPDAMSCECRAEIQVRVFGSTVFSYSVFSLVNGSGYCSDAVQ